MLLAWWSCSEVYFSTPVQCGGTQILTHWGNPAVPVMAQRSSTAGQMTPRFIPKEWINQGWSNKKILDIPTTHLIIFLYIDTSHLFPEMSHLLGGWQYLTFTEPLTLRPMRNANPRSEEIQQTDQRIDDKLVHLSWSWWDHVRLVVVYPPQPEKWWSSSVGMISKFPIFLGK